jgi:hypothetical protein
MRAPHPIEPGGVHYRLMDGEPIVHIADAGNDQAYRSGNRLRGALVELGGARTVPYCIIFSPIGSSKSALQRRI